MFTPSPQNLLWQKGLGRCDGLKSLEMGDDPGLRTWTWYNHEGPHKGEREVAVSIRGRGRGDDGGRGWRDAADSFEDGGRGHHPRKAAVSRSWKGQETVPFQTSDLQNNTRINLCCCELLPLWWYTTTRVVGTLAQSLWTTEAGRRWPRW